MNTERYQELLGRLLEGELPDADAEELAAALRERPELHRDLRSHLVLWELWSQQHTPERSSDAFLNAWKTRVRVESEDAGAFAEAVQSRIGTPRPQAQTGAIARIAAFFAGTIRRPKGMAWAASLVSAISLAVLWFAGTRSAQAVTVLEGEAVCTACVLHETHDHAPALRVVAGPDTDVYYLDRSPTLAALQGYFCNGPTAASAEGKARTEAGRRWFHATTVTIPEARRPEEESTDASRTVLPK